MANAAQKKTTTSTATIIDSSIGLLNSKLPIEKIGLKSNSFRPGAGKPQPASPKWQLPEASEDVSSALTTDSFVVTHGYGNLGVSAWPEATVRHWNLMGFSPIPHGGALHHSGIIEDCKDPGAIRPSCGQTWPLPVLRCCDGR